MTFHVHPANQNPSPKGQHPLLFSELHLFTWLWASALVAFCSYPGCSSSKYIGDFTGKTPWLYLTFCPISLVGVYLKSRL